MKIAKGWWGCGWNDWRSSSSDFIAETFPSVFWRQTFCRIVISSFYWSRSFLSLNIITDWSTNSPNHVTKAVWRVPSLTFEWLSMSSMSFFFLFLFVFLFLLDKFYCKILDHCHSYDGCQSKKLKAKKKRRLWNGFSKRSNWNGWLFGKVVSSDQFWTILGLTKKKMQQEAPWNQHWYM